MSKHSQKSAPAPEPAQASTPETAPVVVVEPQPEPEAPAVPQLSEGMSPPDQPQTAPGAIPISFAKQASRVDEVKVSKEMLAEFEAFLAAKNAAASVPAEKPWSKELEAAAEYDPNAKRMPLLQGDANEVLLSARGPKRVEVLPNGTRVEHF